jgi:hypothetical protein
MSIDRSIESYTFKRTISTIIAFIVLMIYFLYKEKIWTNMLNFYFLYFINSMNYKLLIEFANYIY